MEWQCGTCVRADQCMWIKLSSQQTQSIELHRTPPQQGEPVRLKPACICETQMVVSGVSGVSRVLGLVQGLQRCTLQSAEAAKALQYGTSK